MEGPDRLQAGFSQNKRFSEPENAHTGKSPTHNNLEDCDIKEAE